VAYSHPEDRDRVRTAAVAIVATAWNHSPQPASRSMPGSIRLDRHVRTLTSTVGIDAKRLSTMER
jgi:hypothetical protein